MWKRKQISEIIFRRKETFLDYFLFLLVSSNESIVSFIEYNSCFAMFFLYHSASALDGSDQPRLVRSFIQNLWKQNKNQLFNNFITINQIYGFNWIRRIYHTLYQGWCTTLWCSTAWPSTVIIVIEQLCPLMETMHTIQNCFWFVFYGLHCLIYVREIGWIIKTKYAKYSNSLSFWRKFNINRYFGYLAKYNRNAVTK